MIKIKKKKKKNFSFFCKYIILVVLKNIILNFGYKINIIF